MPDVSVLMTVYNGMPYLPLAVDSVLSQTLRDLRLVIVDDGSTDGTADYLASLTDERVQVVHQPHQGTAAAANHGLTYCDTELVARMDSDDISMPTRLERQRDFLVDHPEIGLVGTQVAPMGEVRAGIGLRLPLDHEKIYSTMLTGEQALAHSSIMFRAALLRKIGGYWSLPWVDDWDMMLRMGEASRLANLDELLHFSRVHAGSLNHSAMREMRMSIDYACELARRRRQNRPLLTYVQFAAMRHVRPRYQRWAETIDLYARGQYRLAVAEWYGKRPWHGAVRLVWAALCAPRRAIVGLGRLIRPSRQPAPKLGTADAATPPDASPLEQQAEV